VHGSQLPHEQHLLDDVVHDQQLQDDLGVLEFGEVVLPNLRGSHHGDHALGCCCRCRSSLDDVDDQPSP
jgi:hypothetical protein